MPNVPNKADSGDVKSFPKCFYCLFGCRNALVFTPLDLDSSMTNTAPVNTKICDNMKNDILSVSIADMASC